MPPARVRHEALDLQPGQVLLFARAHGRASHAREEDRVAAEPGGAASTAAGTAASTIDGMAPLAAVVWHHWLSIVILVPSILIPVAIVVAYLFKVVAPRYGRR